MPGQAPYPGAYPPQQPQQGLVLIFKVFWKTYNNLKFNFRYQAPYPTNDQFGLGGTNVPYPTVGPAMNPPSYDQVRNDNAYQKQSPYNPNFSG